MKVMIKKARLSQIPEMENLYAQFVVDEYKAAPFPKNALHDWRSRLARISRWISEQFLHKRRVWLVAFVDDKIVGTVSIYYTEHSHLSGTVARISLVAVDRDYRRQGIGGALMDHAYKLAKKQGCKFLALEVVSGNAAAMELYLGRGYRPITQELVREID